MKHFIIVGLLVVGLSLTIQQFIEMDTNTFTMLNVILGILAIYAVQRIQEHEKNNS